MRQGTTQAWLIACLSMTFLLAFGSICGARSAPACSDIALVLAVDVSASVSLGEFLLEKRGIAAAFRDPSVLAAIDQAGKVTVSAVFWGADRMPKIQTDWVTVDGPLPADAFARAVETMPRQLTGDTGLAAGLATALARLMSPDVCAARRIINVSGDGRETLVVRGLRRSSSPARVKDLAGMANVEINALSISSDDPHLAEYYSSNVITGPDAFVMDVRDYDGFADAMRRKLIREISPRAVSELLVPQGSEPAGARYRF